MYCGFDVGGTKILGVAVDLPSADCAEAGSLERSAAAGSVEGLRTAAVRRGETVEDGPAIIRAVAEMAAALEADCGVSASAVGVGIAGIVDREGVLRYSPNIRGVHDLEVRRLLREHLRLPVAVENDATAAIWAESQIGAGRGSRYAALVALGTGIGTGFVLDGRLYRGWNGFAGESGHMIVEQAGEEHITGARGPWEHYASGPALRRLAQAAAARGDFDGVIERAGCTAAVAGEHVHAQIASGDPDALAVLDDFCRHAAVGVANLVHVLDPELVIIAGGLVDIGELLVSGIEKWMHGFLLGGGRRPRVRVVPAQLGSSAGAVGAALLAAGVR